MTGIASRRSSRRDSSAFQHALKGILEAILRKSLGGKHMMDAQRIAKILENFIADKIGFTVSAELFRSLQLNDDPIDGIQLERR